LDLTYYLTAGGIKSLVETYGSDRLLYGSGFPDAYFGSAMLMIEQADIPQKNKKAIAGENMLRIIEEIKV
jgi:uncharacterized protein